MKADLSKPFSFEDNLFDILFNPISNCYIEDIMISRHPLPFNPMKDLSEEELRKKRSERKPLAFSHTLTEQISGLIKAGFEITDIYEDCDGGGERPKVRLWGVCCRLESFPCIK